MKIKDLTCEYSKEEIEKQIKKVCLGLLDAFAKVCNEQHLTWWLDGGTLLGAVRDGKMIPWDDDIDVIMPREDYDRLNQLVEVYPSLFGKYFFQTGCTDTCFEVHAKLRDPNTCALTEREFTGTHNRGMFLDIFPLDNAPDTTYFKEDIAGFARTIAKHSGQERRFENSRARDYFSVFNDVLRHVGEQFKHTNLVANMAFWRYDKELRTFKKSDYERTVIITFEDRLCPIPVGFTYVLESLYGKSWMTPKKTVNCHKAFVDPFNSYTNYDNCTKEDFDKLFKRCSE